MAPEHVKVAPDLEHGIMDEEEEEVVVDATKKSPPEEMVDEPNEEVEEVPENTKSSSPPPSYSKILSLGKPEWCMLIIAVVLMVLSEATGLFNPQLVGRAYDTLVDADLDPKERMSEISSIMMLVVVIHLGGVLAAFIRASIMGAAGERIVARLRNQVYGSVLKQEIAFFDTTKTGELVSRLGSDTTLIQTAASTAIPEVILGATKLIAAVALMFWISPELAGVTIGFTFLIFLCCVPFGKTIGALSKRYQDALGEAQTYSTEALGAMRTVQSFAAEDRESKRYGDRIGRPEDFPWWWPNKTATTYSVGFYKSIWTSGFFTFTFGFGFLSMYFSLWYGFKLVNDEKITLGELTAFQSYIFQIGSGLAQTSRFITQVIEAQGASGRVFDLLERQPQIPSPALDGAQHREESQPLVLDTFNGHVEFHDVSFAYPTRPNVPVLRNFSLGIPPNSTAALVGSSGAGKSTVVALLQRFYDVGSGSISIDGTDIRRMDLKWMRKHIGYVQQEPTLFGLTVRENVCYGVDGDVSEKDMIEACRKANAHEFITAWPNGYDTLVGERGIKLSGGQRQRIAIARSILVNPRILLLDEATSALDAESEHLVQEAIENAAIGRTVLIVAHRLSTIRRASKIVVIDNHEIDDAGTHDELMGRCRVYKDLVKRQSIVSRLSPSSAELL